MGFVAVVALIVIVVAKVCNVDSCMCSPPTPSNPPDVVAADVAVVILGGDKNLPLNQWLKRPC